jgi:GSH-dependent disulfide-bond oxidoreductase
MFQMGSVGPMFGQLGFFHRFAGRTYEDKRPRDRYVAESRRVLDVLEQRLAQRPWMMGEAYTIADIAIFPWVRNLIGFYAAGDLVGICEFPNVTRALDAFVRASGRGQRLDHSRLSARSLIRGTAAQSSPAPAGRAAPASAARPVRRSGPPWN